MAAPTVARMSTASGGVCSTCLARIVRQPSSSVTFVRSSIHATRKLHNGVLAAHREPKNSGASPHNFAQDYFSANNSIERGWVKSGLLAAMRTVAEPPLEGNTGLTREERLKRAREEFEKISLDHRIATTEKADGRKVESEIPPTEPREAVPNTEPKLEEVLPHRRRKRRRDNEASAQAASESLPLDASSQLTTAASSMPKSAVFRRRLATYLSLSKPRLSFLILLTTTSAYSLYPLPELLSSTADSVGSSFSTSTLTLLFLTTGTFLSCACANTLNMLFEPKYDALMTRTRNRPLVRGLVSPRAAAGFALLCGATGLLLLGYGTNPTVAGLSALNIFLYAGVYTPMKRISAANTWVGAIVGGIPPLMGWCAAAGEAATSEHHSWRDLLLTEDAIGGWALAALLFAWQFPHFMSLSHTIRDDYRNAGHKMLAWTNPARNARVALRYSLAMFPICGVLYWAGYVDSGFLVISTACNLWMTREAIRFWRKQGAGGSARGLFWASVWQLPLVLVGALVCKRGLWDGFLGKNGPASIYDEDYPDGEGDELGMDSANPSKESKPPADINLAMMGFKRPT
ncbi:Protoheme IX farnesyltransferase, mitochondrial [Exophiala dermatitidis]|uniref:Protoheme IX farnesyltransferase, mitochondrial n=1 Tax=Exophiala dermatitidis (strain ATCC 34100 / CBS 525.76 / NIH/UT8656) TaxID=858893 RepID=H6BJU2_EXODN|nr:protoheme IX farnesyltransferase [Exophiala dermatitidis NIH/UT8656]EHY52312.1 protoheme IX farnesyltransferase [Exophiala dermatitidis NIH/UT8656]